MRRPGLRPALAAAAALWAGTPAATAMMPGTAAAAGMAGAVSGAGAPGPAPAAGAGAPACPAGPPPAQPTVIDRLLDADAAAFAAPDPAAPGGWRLVSAPAPAAVSLEPPDPAAFLARGGAGPAPPLAEGETAIFAHDPMEGVWRRLGAAGPRMRAALTRVMTAARGWDGPFDPARLRLAAELAARDAPALRRLGLAELSAAPAPALRALDLAPDVPRLLAELEAGAGAGNGDGDGNAGGDAGGDGLAPIRARLLGLSGEARARAPLAARLAEAAADPARWAETAALAEALMRLDGPASAERVLDLAAGAQAGAACPGALVEALAAAAQAEGGGLRARIVEGLAAALEDRPALAAPIARAFGARADWAMRPAMEAALSSRRIGAAPDAILAAGYVAAARAAASGDGRGDGRGGAAGWLPD